MATGIVRIFYGEGHGKSTAAMGRALQAASEGKSEFIIHYLIVVVLSIAIGLIYGYSFKANNKIGSITIGPNAIESTDNSVANTEN